MFTAGMLTAALGVVKRPKLPQLFHQHVNDGATESERVKEPRVHTVKRVGEEVDTPYLLPLDL